MDNKLDNNQWWFIKTYNELVSSRKYRGLDKTKLEGYYEVHHILPRSLGGTDDIENLVLFTSREHIIAHLLLTRVYPDNLKVMRASIMMTLKDGKRFSPRIIASLRESYSLMQLKRNKELREKYGYVLSKETRDKMSKSRTGHFTSEETKIKISESEKGKIVNDITRKKLSDSYNDTAERREKLSAAAKKSMEDNNIRSKISSSLKSKSKEQNKRGLLVSDGTNIYESFTECAKAHGISRKRVRELVDDPTSNFCLIGSKYTPKKVIGPDGTVYNSITDCYKRTGHSKRTIQRWIEKYPEKGYKFKD